MQVAGASKIKTRMCSAIILYVAWVITHHLSATSPDLQFLPPTLSWTVSIVTSSWRDGVIQWPHSVCQIYSCQNINTRYQLVCLWISTDWNFEIENGSMVKVLWKWKYCINTSYQLVCQWDWAQTGFLKLKMTAWSKSYESESTAAVVGSL